MTIGGIPIPNPTPNPTPSAILSDWLRPPDDDPFPKELFDLVLKVSVE